MENDYNIIYEGQRLLIHLVRHTTKEEKITQYDVIHTKLDLFNPLPISHIGQTHSNNSSAIADELFECVLPICWIGA